MQGSIPVTQAKPCSRLTPICDSDPVEDLSTIRHRAITSQEALGSPSPASTAGHCHGIDQEIETIMSLTATAPNDCATPAQAQLPTACAPR